MNLLQQQQQDEPTSFAAHRGVRVAVVALGGIPEARFRTYFTLLKRFTDLPLANLSKPGSWKKEKSPFKYFSWFDGALSMQYVDRSASAALAAAGRPSSSEWQDYQAHRRIWAVVGIVHIPSCAPGALKSIEQEFQVL